MRLKYYLSLLLFIAGPWILSAQNYESMRVAKVEVIADNLNPDCSFSQATVKSQLLTKTGNFFSQTEFDNDLKMLAAEYDRVEPCIEVINNEIYVSLTLFFKPSIASITFCGNEHVKTKKLLKKFDICAGSTFDREKFIEEFNKLKILYVKKGYFEAELDYEIVPIEGCNQVDIYITVSEGRAGKIKKICFYGLSSCDEDEILDLMMTKKYLFFLSWYTGRGTYHPEMIEHDRLQVINYFQNQGYADALVDICIEDCPQTDRIIVRISVDKGIRYTIGNMTLQGNCLFTNKDIWKRFTFGRGSYYSPEKIRTTIQAINDLYGAQGHIDSTVDIHLHLREDCPIYDVEILIEEGSQFHVGLIKVFGNHCTQTNVILHESLLCPGEIFNNKKLQGTESRIRNTGFFDCVNVYPVQSQITDPCGEQHYRDIYIEVSETDTGNIGLFCGFSSIDRLFGGVEITEQNFNIAGLTKLTQEGVSALRGGGEFTHAKINVGDRSTSYILQWTKPYFMDTPWIVGVDLEKNDNRQLSKAYETKVYGGNVHAIYIINDYLKYDMHYRARHTSTNARGDQNQGLERAAENAGFISAAGMTFIYDSTDHPRKPTRGQRSRLLYEVAGLGGNYQFMRLSYLNSYYYPLSKRGTLKFRGDLQFLKTYSRTEANDLPLSELFYLGGETSVRGYRNFILGPKFGNNEPAGGLSSLLLSEEYQYNILRNPCLDGFIFVDAGYVSRSEFTLGKYAATVGFGIRVELMRNTPIMAGFGWPMHPEEFVNGEPVQNTQRFFFAMGSNF